MCWNGTEDAHFYPTNPEMVLKRFCINGKGW